MTIYIFIFLLLIIFALMGSKDRKLDSTFFVVEIIMLTLLLCFRYGQGSDYHNYEGIFEGQKYISGLAYEKEKLFALFNMLIARLGWSYSAFVGLVGLICMLFTYRGIYKLSSIKTVSILLLFPTYYLTYYFSAIREGIALSMTIGVVLPLILEKKWKTALLSILFISFIHQSSIIMLIMLLNIPWHRYRKLILTGSAVFGIGLWGALQYVTINIHELTFSPSYTAVVIRLGVFILISVLFEKSEKSPETQKLYDIYLIGLCIYLCAFAAALFSQRGTAYFKIVEILLIPNMLGYIVPVSATDCRYAMRKTVFTGMIALCVIEGIKNLASYPQQMNYPEHISFYNYPYISIFDKEQEKLYKDGI